MKDVIKQITIDQIDLSDANIQVDATRIKQLTLKKISQNRSHTFVKKAIGIAATFICVVAITGISTYALSSPSTRSYIGELLGFETGEVLLVGKTIHNRDYSMAVEDFIYDGSRGEVTLSVTALSNSAKQRFATEKISDLFGHLSVSSGLGELTQFNEADTRFFSLSFSTTINEYDHLRANREHLVFAFTGMKDVIKIPLEPTLATITKEIYVPSQPLYPIEYDTLVYSNLGFTLIGTQVHEDASYENITIEFILKNGERIQFATFYEPLRPNNHLTPTDNTGKVTHDTVLIDGKKEHVTISTNDTVVNPNVDFTIEFDENLYSGSGGSGYTSSTPLRETSFSFQKNFNWDAVDQMIINGATIEF